MTDCVNQKVSRRILLIDDSIGFTHSIEGHLKLDNYECVVSNDLITGLASILEERFDIVVVNADIPEFNDDIMNFIIINAKLNDQKIIILKSVPLLNERVKELNENGTCYCLDKSISPQELLHTIKSCHNFIAIPKQKINTIFTN